MARALLDPADAAEAGPPVASIPLDLIDPNPQNPRKALHEIDALADNIRQFGLLQPILVRRHGDRFELLGGHRRIAAYKLLAEREPHEPKWRAITALVRHEDDADTLLRMLISGQVHINAWSAREEAATLEYLVRAGQNVTEVGQSLNKSTAWASKRLRVHTDSVLSGYVQSGRLLPGIAEEILPVADVATKKQIAQEAARLNLSQQQVKDRVRSLSEENQLNRIRRLAGELLECLSAVDPRQFPAELARDLWTIRRRIDVLGKGSERHVPTIEEAQRAAGVRTMERPLKRGQKRLPGYKPKL